MQFFFSICAFDQFFIVRFSCFETIIWRRYKIYSLYRIRCETFTMKKKTYMRARAKKTHIFIVLAVLRDKNVANSAHIQQSIPLYCIDGSR